MKTQQDTIVIAENNMDIFADLEVIFSSNGFRVEHLPNLEAIKNKRGDATPFVLILGDLGRVSLLEEFRAAGQLCPVIVLHSNGSVSEAVIAIRAGADDYFSHPFCPKNLLKSVLAALSKARRQAQIATANRVALQCAALLTRREREVVDLALAGLLNKEIAAHLRLALVTVKVHRGKAMRKMGARTPAELARIALELRIDSPQPFATSYQLPAPATPYQSVGT